MLHAKYRALVLTRYFERGYSDSYGPIPKTGAAASSDDRETYRLVIVSSKAKRVYATTILKMVASHIGPPLLCTGTRF